MQDLAQYKEEVENKILDAITKGLEEEKITPEDSQVIAGYVLENISSVQDKQGILNIFAEMQKRWPIFTDIIELEKGMEDRQAEMAAASNIAHMIKTGQASTATKQAKQLIED